MSSISCVVAQLTLILDKFCKYASLFQQAFCVSDFFTSCEPNACGNFLESIVDVENPLYARDISFSAFLCPSVGPQDIKT